MNLSALPGLLRLLDKFKALTLVVCQKTQMVNHEQFRLALVLF